MEFELIIAGVAGFSILALWLIIPVEEL